MTREEILEKAEKVEFMLRNCPNRNSPVYAELKELEAELLEKIE